MNEIRQNIGNEFNKAGKAVTNTAKSFVNVPKAYLELLKAYKKVNKTEKALINALVEQQMKNQPLFAEHNCDGEEMNKVGLPPKINDMVENVKGKNKDVDDTINKLKVILGLGYDIYKGAETEWLATKTGYKFIEKNQKAINDCYNALYDFSTKAMNTKLTTYKAMNNAVMTYRVFLIATFFLGIGLGTYHLVSANDGTENTAPLGDPLGVDVEDTELIDADDTQQTENTETSISTSAYMLDEMTTGEDEPFDFDSNGNIRYGGDDTNVRALIDEYNAEVPEFAKKDLMQLQQALVQQNLTDEELTQYMGDAFTMQAHLYDLDKRFRIEDNKIIYGQGGPDNIAFTDYATNTKHPQAFRDFMTHYEDDNTPPTTDVIPDASDNETPTTETTETTETTTTETPTEVEDPDARIYNHLKMTRAEWDEFSPDEKARFTRMVEYSLQQEAELQAEIAELNELIRIAETEKKETQELIQQRQELEAQLKDMQNK